MRKVFWDDPYQRQLTTKVRSVEGSRILLDETIAFSFSGGQESDKASINGQSIIDSKIEDLLIFYTLEEGHGLGVGDTVTMEIDWPRRYKLMRLHFAAELILEIITQKYQLKKIGAHIGEAKSRIDFVCDYNISTVFAEVLAQYNQIIANDEIINTGFSDVATQRRYWKITGFAQVPCGGTHVKSTAEVGLVTLKRVNLGGSKERIEIRLVESL